VVVVNGKGYLFTCACDDGWASPFVIVDWSASWGKSSCLNSEWLCYWRSFCSSIILIYKGSRACLPEGEVNSPGGRGMLLMC